MKKKVIISILSITLLLSFVLNGQTQINQINSSNNYVFIFQGYDYSSKLSDTIKYIFKDLIKPDDQLTIVTPLKSYSFSQKTRKSLSQDKLIKLTIKVLKRDIINSATKYQAVLSAMLSNVNEIGSILGINNRGGMTSRATSSSSLKPALVSYHQLLEELHNLRKFNEVQLINLAKLSKNFNGKKYIFIVYQKELKIIPNRKTMDVLRNNNNIKFDVLEAFLHDKNKEFLDSKKIINTLNESDITFNFIYFKSKPKRIRGVQLKEFSGDIYNSFSKIAKGTGGKIITTSKPKVALKNILKK